MAHCPGILKLAGVLNPPVTHVLLFLKTFLVILRTLCCGTFMHLAVHLGALDASAVAFFSLLFFFCESRVKDELCILADFGWAVATSRRKLLIVSKTRNYSSS